MSYVQAFGVCASCTKMFSFHPNFVPSIPMRDGKVDPTGQREPICRECMDAVNIKRINSNLNPLAVHPQAYSEAREEDIDWTDNRTLLN